MGLSRYLKNRLLDYYLSDGVYLSLHDSDPEDNGVGEIGGYGYARHPIGFDASKNGAKSTSNLIVFNDMPECTVTHFGLWDAPSGGNFLQGCPVEQAQKYHHGDIARIPIGKITIKIP